MISVIILTKNEEKNLSRCLKSLKWSDDVHVLDSGSTDQTVPLAKKYGANVSFNEFETFGQQRNHALKSIKTKYNWILFLDADEVPTPEFVEEVRSKTSSADDEIAGYYCCWKTILEGQWLKRCDNFPKWQFRLLKKGRANFTDFGHGQKEGEVDGILGYIEEPYLHYSFSNGWTHWISKHNKYSSQEARARVKKKPPFKNMFSENSSKRNPALKSWLTKIPGWPLLRFIQAYVFNLGFLEGKPGFIYCTNMAFYEYLVKIKIREMKHKKK